MKQRFPYFIIVTIILAACSYGSDNALSSKKRAITSFYSIVTSSNLMGIPEAGDRNRLSPYNSAGLQSLLIRGAEAEKKYAAASKEPVPPMIEGSLFVSLFEGADSFGAITPEEGKRDTFLIELVYRDKPSGKHPFTWKDRVICIHENGRWVIDDIVLRGTWDFGRKGSVKHILHEVIKDAGGK